MNTGHAVLNVLIVGAGNIGAFFDEPGFPKVLTHAHAINDNPAFRIAGFVDTNSENGKKAVAVWGGAYFGSISEAFNAVAIDIVAVTVPDEFHYAVLKELANYKVKLVFAEKPLTKRIDEALNISALYRQRNISLLVNYTRRFVPEYQQLRDDIRGQRYGAYVTGTGYYGKGILHNGSHMIDLLRFLVGDEFSGAVNVQKIFDFFQDDPSVAGFLSFRNGSTFHLQTIRCDLYTVFEIDLFFEKVRIRMIDSGYRIQFYHVEPSATFKNYFNLAFEKEIQTGSALSLAYAYDHIRQHIFSGEPLICPAEEACKSMQTCIVISDTAVAHDK